MIVLAASRFAFGQSVVDISQGWRFIQGDDDAWSAIDAEDSDWQEIEIGKPWEQQGYADYAGFAWYRLHICIPESVREQEAFRLSESLLLSLGRIDDVDATWFNGTKIGDTGAFPPEFESAWNEPRVYRIPASLIRWNKDNVIAVRVYDGLFDGGMVLGPYSLRIADLNDLVAFEWILNEGGGLFSGDDAVGFIANLRNDSPTGIDGELLWTLRTDEGETVSRSSDRVTLAPNSVTPITRTFAPSVPGFYDVHGVLRSAVHDVELEWTKVIGYRAEDIKSPLTREADFDSFWNETLEALSDVDPEFDMRPRADRDSPTHEVFEVTMRSLGGVRVRGWYERPKEADHVPALLRVPGYGGNMQPSGEGKPIAIFSFNPRAHGNSQDDVPGQPRDYWIRGLDDKQGYYYQGAYADCVRAVDFLASRSEIDSSRIGITGESQGGGLSLATAALDDRISLCAPDIPFLCDWVKYFKASHWPEMDRWIAAEPGRSWETTLRTLSYFDTLNMAERIDCPVLLNLGVQDPVCPAATVFAVFDRIPGRKEFRAYPNTAHRVEAEYRAFQREWIWQEFNRAPD